MEDNFNVSEILLKEYTKMDIEAESDLDLLAKISDVLYREGAVEKGFKEAIVQREQEFPTGLMIGGHGFAIPHTDAQYVKKVGVVLLRLKKPVSFKAMATMDEYVDLKIVFLLLLKNTGFQASLLQSLINLCTEEGILDKLEKADSEENMIKVIEEFYQPELV